MPGFIAESELVSSMRYDPKVPYYDLVMINRVKEISDLKSIPIARLKVRALVKCGDEYLFIQRQKYGKKKKFLSFPGGGVKKSDRNKRDPLNIDITLHNAIVRELTEELAASDINIGQCLSISKPIKHDREVLFNATIGSYDWDARTGKEFVNPYKGKYELVKITELTKEILDKNGYNLKPKEWRKLLYSYNT